MVSRINDTLDVVRRLSVRQRIASVGLEEQDYLAHHVEGEQVALQLFQMRHGRIQSRREFSMDDTEFDAGPFYAAVLTQYYQATTPPAEIYLPAQPDQAELLGRWLGDRRGGRVRLRVPQRGVKRRFLEVVRKNAELAFARAPLSTEQELDRPYLDERRPTTPTDESKDQGHSHHCYERTRDKEILQSRFLHVGTPRYALQRPGDRRTTREVAFVSRRRLFGAYLPMIGICHSDSPA